MTHLAKMAAKYLNSSTLCVRYSISRRTLARWLVDPPKGFPKSLLLNGRHLWREDEIEAWERTLAASCAKAA